MGRTEGREVRFAGDSWVSLAPPLRLHPHRERSWFLFASPFSLGCYYRTEEGIFCLQKGY